MTTAFYNPYSLARKTVLVTGGSSMIVDGGGRVNFE